MPFFMKKTIVNTQKTGHSLLPFFMLLAAFTIGTTENIISGMLNDISTYFRVSTSAAGYLTTVYAGVAVIAGPIMVVFTHRINKRIVVIAMMSLFVIANLLCAFSFNFLELLVARGTSAIAHSILLATFISVAMSISEEGKQGSAGAKITVGLSLATIIGVPLSSYIGHFFSWRYAFFGVAIAGFCLLLGFVKIFPHNLSATPTERSTILHSILKFHVLSPIAATIFTSAGALALFTYLSVIDIRAGINAQYVSSLMLLYGIGAVIGGILGGKIADHGPAKSAMITVSATAIIEILSASIIHNTLGLIILTPLLGMSYFSTFPALNTTLVKVSRLSDPALSLTLNSSAFNIGITIGSLIGGILLAKSNEFILALCGGVIIACGAIITIVNLKKTDSLNIS